MQALFDLRLQEDQRHRAGDDAEARAHVAVASAPCQPVKTKDHHRIQRQHRRDIGRVIDVVKGREFEQHAARPEQADYQSPLPCRAREEIGHRHRPPDRKIGQHQPHHHQRLEEHIGIARLRHVGVERHGLGDQRAGDRRENHEPDIAQRLQRDRALLETKREKREQEKREENRGGNHRRREIFADEAGVDDEPQQEPDHRCRRHQPRDGPRAVFRDRRKKHDIADGIDDGRDKKQPVKDGTFRQAVRDHERERDQQARRLVPECQRVAVYLKFFLQQHHTGRKRRRAQTKNCPERKGHFQTLKDGAVKGITFKI